MARAADGRIPGLLPLRVPGTPHGRRRRRASAGRRAGRRHGCCEGGSGRCGGASSRRGCETQLGPTWPDGVEVSFGQWQKLALARGFMRDHPLLLVLDEPTAALDAETEHALFERYAAAAAGEGHDAARADGRITILVSHRFSTVRMADIIVVLDGAKVVEVGSHDDLIAQWRPVLGALRHPGRRLPAIACAGPRSSVPGA